MIIDTHTHPLAGWKAKEADASIQNCGFEKAIAAASPLDHWGSALNKETSRLVDRHPTKLVGLVGIHPPDVEQSLRDIETYGKKGFKGIKLMPTAGYYPDDERFRKIFEEVNARKWMVLMHCGWCSKGVKEKDLPQSTRFSDPYHVEPLIRIFPDTDFILAHGGGRVFYPRAWELVSYHENVYVDTCPGQGPWALQNGVAWLGLLNWKRVLFGTDTLIGHPHSSQGFPQTVALIKGILRNIGCAEHTDAVMRDNAKRLLQKHGVQFEP